jgi:hypothetical protein
MMTEFIYFYFLRNNQAAILNFASISMPQSMQLFCIKLLQNCLNLRLADFLVTQPTGG